MTYPGHPRFERRKLEAKASGEPGWNWRKALIYPNVVVSFYLIFLLINGPDTRVNETIAWGLIVNIITSVLFMTGFATAQDVAAIMATRTGLPYAEPPQYYQQTTTVAPADSSQPITTTTTVAPQPPQPPSDEPVLDGPGPGARP